VSRRSGAVNRYFKRGSESFVIRLPLWKSHASVRFSQNRLINIMDILACFMLFE